MFNIALPKGRLGNRVYDLMSSIGYPCRSFADDNRKLVFEDVETGVRYLLVKPSDVAIYVERGVADAGVVGKDILLEYEPDVYELLDLGIGGCTLIAAARVGFREDTDRVLRVATKYINVAKRYYASLNREIELVKLNGSVELAPLLGLSDVIVDIMETGTTLKENGLAVIGAIAPVSARFIANRAAYRFKNEEIGRLAERLGEAVTA
jgi:ATP phosphoribosyltransferase